MKRIKKLGVIVAISAAMMLSLTACGNPDAKNTATEAGTQDGDSLSGELKIKKDLEDQANDAIKNANDAINNADKLADPNSDY